jgi:hypothetical protein
MIHDPYSAYVQFPFVDWATASLNLFGALLAAYLFLCANRFGPIIKRIKPIILAMFLTCLLGVFVQVARSFDGSSDIGMLRRELDQLRDFADAFTLLLLVNAWIKRRMSQ